MVAPTEYAALSVMYTVVSAVGVLLIWTALEVGDAGVIVMPAGNGSDNVFLTKQVPAESTFA